MESWDWPKLIPVVLGSCVISAFLAIWLGKLKNTKHIRIEQVGLERKEWRERLTKLVVNSRNAFDKKDKALFKRIEAELIVKLNPADKEDQKIIQLADEVSETWDVEKLEEFQDRLSLLIRYDWKLAKQATSSSLKLRFMAVLLALCIALPYMYFEENMGKEIGDQILSLPADYAIPGLALIIIVSWMVVNGLSQLNSLLLSLFFGNVVRGRYKKRKKNRKPIKIKSE